MNEKKTYITVIASRLIIILRFCGIRLYTNTVVIIWLQKDSLVKMPVQQNFPQFHKSFFLTMHVKICRKC